MDDGEENEYTNRELKFLIELIDEDFEAPMPLINEIKANRDFIDTSLSLKEIRELLPVKKKTIIKISNESGLKKANIYLSNQHIIEIKGNSKEDLKIKFFKYKNLPYLSLRYQEVLEIIDQAIKELTFDNSH